MQLSIIIVSWNTCRLLRRCLRSIASYPPRNNYEVIVIDNGSVDGSADMVRSDFPDVCLVPNVRNTGFAPANNQGFKVAKGSYVLLLGSDTEVRDCALQSMIAFLRSHPEAGAVSPKLISPDGRLQRSCKRFPTLGNALAMYCSLHWLNKHYLMEDFDHDSLRQVDQPDATSIMFRRELIEEIGGFDENYSILYNDVDLCQKLKKRGKSRRLIRGSANNTTIKSRKTPTIA